MDALRQQITALIDELNLVKTELIQVKASHANMHQQDVESRNRMHTLEQQLDIVQREAGTAGGAKGKSLIELKNVIVGIFKGSITKPFNFWKDPPLSEGQYFNLALCSPNCRIMDGP